MVKYHCDTCQKTFAQKGHLEDHQKRKRPCKADNTLDAIVEKKVNEAMCRRESELIPMTTTTAPETANPNDCKHKTREELIAICKAKCVKGYSGKKKDDVMRLLFSNMTNMANTSVNMVANTDANMVANTDANMVANTDANMVANTDANMVANTDANMVADANKTKHRVMSLFSGMGGMDVGFAEQVVVHEDSVTEPHYVDSRASTDGFVNLKRLPFVVVFQNDILPEAKRISELNQWNHNFVLKDIRTLLEDAQFIFPIADVMTGGFPCQDFSHAGKRKGLDSNRGTLYQSYVELVRRVKPLIFVAENVHGLLTMPGEPIKRIMDDFAVVGYDVQYQLIKCEEHGIPQTRHRVIIMGVRSDKRPLLTDNWNIIDENKARCLVGSYFKHLREPDVSDDPAQQSYSKAARLAKGQGQKEVGLDEFAPTMRAEHHGNIEFRRIIDGKNLEPHLSERRLQGNMQLRNVRFIVRKSPVPPPPFI
jgi:DNA (cytosine-5)-methyltransferase 1